MLLELVPDDTEAQGRLIGLGVVFFWVLERQHRSDVVLSLHEVVLFDMALLLVDE